MTSLGESRVLEAIETITCETGYPPTLDELAAAVGGSTRQVHSALMNAKRRGVVVWDDDCERLVLAAREQT